MLSEYAVEPEAISRDLMTCLHLADKFGFDRGRLLSLFPKAWLPQAIAATGHLGDAEKKRVTERLIELKRRASIRRGRDFDGAKTWLDNALAQQAAVPFRAIIAANNSGGATAVLTPDQVEDANPLVNAPQDAQVIRTAPDLTAALDLLLRTAQRALFVDPYYDPFNTRYQQTLRACLAVLFGSTPGATCEIHHMQHSKCPPIEAIEREAKAKFAGVIPGSKAVTIFRWEEIDGGADFHARYLLTDKGGIAIDAGFSAEGGHQTTDMHLMSYQLSQTKIAALAHTAAVYRLCPPILSIGSDGTVKHLA